MAQKRRTSTSTFWISRKKLQAIFTVVMVATMYIVGIVTYIRYQPEKQPKPSTKPV